MSVKLLYDVKGGDELEKALRDLRKEMKGKEGNITASSLMKAAYPVWRDAQARAPVSEAGAFTAVRFTKKGVKRMGPGKDQPGTLRKSIKRQRHPNPSAWSELVGIGVFVPSGTTRKNNLGPWYAHFVEFGTKIWGGKPFLRPALEANRAEFVGLFASSMGSGIEREAKKIGKKYGDIVNNSANRMKFKGRS